MGLQLGAREVDQRVGAQDWVWRRSAAAGRCGAKSADLPEEMIFNVNYLGGEMPTFNLNFSRPGGQVVTQYYNFIRLGREGYARVHGATYETCGHLAQAIAALGPFEIVHDGAPAAGIPAVSWKLTDGASTASTCSTSPTACARTVGWCRRTRCRRNLRGARDPADPGAPRLQPRHGRTAARRRAPQPADAGEHPPTRR